MNLANVVLASAALAAAQMAGQDGRAGNPGVPWPATDALGRSLPLSRDVGPPKRDRWVGIFYFLWHDNPGGKSPNWDGPYDVARILQADPDAIRKPNSPLWGPISASHYWGEPLYGYYLGADPWVLRRHAQLLADAGVDTLIFDTTNAVTYQPVYRKLCEVFTQIRAEGGHTPQIAFMVNTQAGSTAQRIYDDLYKPGLYRELWFQWQGKPLMLCDPSEASPELRSFFTLRKAHWPFQMINTSYAWHWEAAYPQPYGYTDAPSKPEQVNVSVAQNLRVRDGRVTNMSAGNARGRGFHDGIADHSAEAIRSGPNFQEQWKRALALDSPFVMVTGWNEWIAGRWGEPGGPITFVDQFTEEYSRDIEPMRGGHGDDYYWQLVANVRRYKGAPPLPAASAPKSIRVDRPFTQWNEVFPAYQAHSGARQPRDFAGAGGTHYANRTGRNEFACLKVARDKEKVYFYARTLAPITQPEGRNWMWLLIDADQSRSTGWEGYDFLVNRDRDAPDYCWLEKNVGGWQWRRVARVRYRVAGTELQIALPRAALGLARGKSSVAIDFKWIDNCQQPGDIMDAYVSGDAAPIGRFNYRYQAE